MSPPRKRTSSSAAAASAGRSKKKRIHNNRGNHDDNESSQQEQKRQQQEEQKNDRQSQYAPGQVSNMLIRVVNQNDIPQLRELLQLKDSGTAGSLAVTDHEIHICLPRAANAGLVTACRLLFHRLSPQGQEKYTVASHTRGFGALHEAALLGRIPVLQLLVETFHFNVNQLNEIHATPLSTALPCLATTRFLLEHGANPNLPNQGRGNGRFNNIPCCWPLYTAVAHPEKSSVALLQLLLEVGRADPNFNCPTLQHLQEYNAKHLRQHQQQRHEEERCSLITNVAIRKGKFQMVDLLLQYGAFVGSDTNIRRRNVEDDDDDAADVADDDDDDDAATALNEYLSQRNVSRNDKLTMCRTLVEHANKNRGDVLAFLHVALAHTKTSTSSMTTDMSAFDHVQRMQASFHGGDITSNNTTTTTTTTTTGNNGNTALHHVQILLEAGLDAVRAMHYCIQQNHVHGCRLLLEMQVVDPFRVVADGHQPRYDNDGNNMAAAAASPFHEAARLEDTTILKDLFLPHWDERFKKKKNGGKDDAGDYPLHVLCCDDQVSLAAMQVVVQHCREEYNGSGTGGDAVAVLQAMDGQEGFFPIHLAANWDVSLNVLYYLLRQCPAALLVPSSSSSPAAAAAAAAP